MIIVTGGAGFVGSNLVKALNERGREDVLVVDDVRDGRKLQNLVDCEVFDLVDPDVLREWLRAARGGHAAGRPRGRSAAAGCARKASRSEAVSPSASANVDETSSAMRFGFRSAMRSASACHWFGCSSLFQAASKKSPTA